MTDLCRHVEVIFCDDIREEVGGKFSYMGIYTGDMIMGGLPAILPKLCIAANVVTPVDDPFERLQLNIYQDGIEQPIITTGPLPPSPKTENEDNSVWLMAHMMFVLSPFQVEKETALRVVAETERGLLRGRSLRIICPGAKPTEQTH